MMVIGITGGIGTGKTTAAEYLEEKGLALIDADQISRELTADGQPILEEIQEQFGCVTDDGALGNGLVLDRKAMADLIFNNREVKEEYDQLIHTEIIAIIDKMIEELSETDAKGILLDAPLLFEANINDRCDVVILITADMDMRIGRVSLRDDAYEEDVQERIDNQMSDDEKARASDFIVDNSGEPEEMFRQLDDIMEYLGVL